MVVGQDHAHRVRRDRRMEDLARMGARGVERSHRDRLPGQQMVLGVEIERHEVLLAGPADLLHLTVRLTGRAHDNLVLVLRRPHPAADLEDGLRLAGAGPSYPAVRLPLLEAQILQPLESVASHEEVGDLEDVLGARPRPQDERQQLAPRQRSRPEPRHLLSRLARPREIADPVAVADLPDRGPTARYLRNPPRASSLLSLMSLSIDDSRRHIFLLTITHTSPVADRGPPGALHSRDLPAIVGRPQLAMRTFLPS